MKIEVYERKGRLRRRKQWGWRVVADNNKRLCGSEGYYNAADAAATAHQVTEAGPLPVEFP